MLSRREWLIGSLAFLGCSRGKGGGAPSGNAKGFAPVFESPRPEQGFFSLRSIGDTLLAGTYGSPRCYSTKDGDAWRDVSGDLPSAGESLFDIVPTGMGIFGATERTGGIYQFHGAGWNRVFSVGGDWTNAYAGVDFDGRFVTGFNNFPTSNQTLVVMGPPWQTHVLGQYNHFRPGVVHGVLYGVARRNSGGVAILRFEGGNIWSEVGGFDSGNGFKISDGYVGLEPAAIGRIPSGIMTNVGGFAFIAQVLPSRGLAVASQGWRALGGRGAVIGFHGNIVAELSEPEAWCIEEFQGKVYVGTRQEGGGGKIYREL